VEETLDVEGGAAAGPCRAGSRHPRDLTDAEWALVERTVDASGVLNGIPCVPVSIDGRNCSLGDMRI
jgi:hypothetical protein